MSWSTSMIRTSILFAAGALWLSIPSAEAQNIIYPQTAVRPNIPWAQWSTNVAPRNSYNSSDYASAPGPGYQQQQSYASYNKAVDQAYQAYYGRASQSQQPFQASYQEESTDSQIANPRFRRQVVTYDGKEAAGTVIINTNE